MTELDRIVETIADWDSRGVPFALATVVGVRGSTYRGLGARQLVSGQGVSVGTISGGCLDNDLRQVASRVIESGEPTIVEFDLTSDDEAIWGWGIGCNGATEVLVQPAPAAVEFARQLGGIHPGKPTAIIHSLDPGTLGERRLMTDPGAAPILGKIAEEAQAALRDSRNRVVDVEDARALVEVVGSPSQLIVCGAGHDADPLVRLAVDLGFVVTVTDDRRHLLTPERFAEPTEVVLADAADFSTAVHLDDRSYVVLMSHNYLRDLEYLRQLRDSEVAYVGALGPSERLERLLSDLESEGRPLSPEMRERIHGPAGLDIGAEGPLEIAWSILSEILAVRSGRDGGSISAPG